MKSAIKTHLSLPFKAKTTVCVQEVDRILLRVLKANILQGYMGSL